MTEKHPAEDIAEMLGDPLPTDWRDPLATEARAQHLAALADEASDAALALVLYYSEHGSAPPIDDPMVDVFADAVFELDSGSRRYTHDTQNGNAADIIYTAVALKLGSEGADWISASLERVREHWRQRTSAIADT